MLYYIIILITNNLIGTQVVRRLMYSWSLSLSLRTAFLTQIKAAVSKNLIKVTS